MRASSGRPRPLPAPPPVARTTAPLGNPPETDKKITSHPEYLPEKPARQHATHDRHTHAPAQNDSSHIHVTAETESANRRRDPMNEDRVAAVAVALSQPSPPHSPHPRPANIRSRLAAAPRVLTHAATKIADSSSMPRRAFIPQKCLQRQPSHARRSAARQNAQSRPFSGRSHMLEATPHQAGPCS